MAYNTCQTYFLNQDTSTITYCRTEWVRLALRAASRPRPLVRIADVDFARCSSVEAGQLARVGLLGYEQRPRRTLRCDRPALVCPVSILNSGLWVGGGLSLSPGCSTGFNTTRRDGLCARRTN